MKDISASVAAYGVVPVVVLNDPAHQATLSSALPTFIDDGPYLIGDEPHFFGVYY